MRFITLHVLLITDKLCLFVFQESSDTGSGSASEEVSKDTTLAVPPTSQSSQEEDSRDSEAAMSLLCIAAGEPKPAEAPTEPVSAISSADAWMFHV